MNIADLRNEYKRERLDEADVAPEPFLQFRRWFETAVAAKLPEPNAMTLATVGATGRPSARIVLLKGIEPDALQFYTNFASRKGAELGTRPDAALVFFWPELERQVRIEGIVSAVTDVEADAYFASRPRASRLAAWASPQSEAIADRQALESRFAEAEARFRDVGDAVPRPPRWGGFRLVPEVFEFWQGRASRMHDRIRYRRAAGPAWLIDRLAP